MAFDLQGFASGFRMIGGLAVLEDSEGLTRTVLVVEDDQLFRATLCELLGTFGVGVQPVGDADEAVRALRTTAFDAVITDMDIPGDGSTVLRYTEALRPEIPVIVLTALPPSRVPAKTVFRRLFKPASVGEIRNALSDAFDESPTESGS
jgi:CheY-like chemotaxis protein